MNTRFRIKYMRFVAVLMAVAVLAGSVDTGMLRVQAYESDAGNHGDIELFSGSEDTADKSETVDNDADDESLEVEGGRAVSGNDIEDEDKKETGTDSTSDEDDAAVGLAGADELTDVEEDGKEQVTISGVKILSTKKYDGIAMAYEKNEVKATVERTSEADEEPEQTGKTEIVDVTKDVTFQYAFVGYEANGSLYSSDDAPTNAGAYRLIVTVSDDNYVGRQEYGFEITKRTIIITPYYEDILMVGDVMPPQEDYKYEISGDGFAGAEENKEDFKTPPTITCEVEYADDPGEYTLTASGADAGDNYEIIYKEGKLTVSEPEPPKAKLLRVVPPNAVRNVAFGTKLVDIPLPETVEIVIENLAAQEGDLNEKRDTAAVEWVRVPIDGTSYSPSKSTEQTFRLGGTVILPNHVELPEDAEEQGLSLNVTIEVNVREKMESTLAVATPTASIASGSRVQYGTAVELLCETEGALIYYTLNGQNPTTASNLYSGSIGIYGDVVIRAYAVKTGYPDSSVEKFSYYVSSTSGSTDGEEKEPEVPKEDIPSSGVIPPGLWTPEVKNELVYTGQAIKPAVRVYDYKTLLTENKDYTVSYKNNVNAADVNAAKAPTITITGKGNYEGKLTRTFTIKPKNINDTDVSIDDITVAYNKKAQKPSPTVMWNGKKLTNKKDYAVQDVSYTDVGSRTITVTGSGNYTGTRFFVFTITDGIPVSKLTVAKIPDQTYNWGAKIEPALSVKYKGQQLSSEPDNSGNQDYSVTYLNNMDVGTATAVIEGKGDYVGIRKVTFKIKEIASLSKAKIDVQFDSTVYTGRPITASGMTVTMNLKGESGETVTTPLTYYKDYTVTYQKNDKVGTATIVFTGIGAYRGTAKKTFKVTACDMQSERVRISMDNSHPYMKGGSKPEPVVYFGGTILKLGTDYTLSYKQNNAVGSTATVTVKGKGNFKGSRTGNFTVTTQDIKNVTVSVADKVYQNKKNIYKTTVRLTDTNGKALSAGTDYDKNIEYTYAEETNVKIDPDDEKGIIRKEGAAVEQDDIIPAGTTIRVTISAKGNNYTGEVSGTYRIVGANILGAKVTIPTQTYTGKEIKPDSQIQVVLKGQALSSDDYRIVEYSNNINKGTAKVVLQGLGNYGGTKTATFKIKGKGLFN